LSALSERFMAMCTRYVLSDESPRKLPRAR
jgi:hypothetical protein